MNVVYQKQLVKLISLLRINIYKSQVIKKMIALKSQNTN